MGACGSTPAPNKAQNPQQQRRRKPPAAPSPAPAAQQQQPSPAPARPAATPTPQPASPTPPRQQQSPSADGHRRRRRHTNDTPPTPPPQHWVCVASRAGGANVKFASNDASLTVAAGVPLGSVLVGTGAVHNAWREVLIDGGKGWIKTAAMGVVYFEEQRAEREDAVEGAAGRTTPQLSLTASDISEDDLPPSVAPTAPAYSTGRSFRGGVNDGSVNPGSPRRESGPGSPGPGLEPQHPFGRATMAHLRDASAAPNAPPAPSNNLTA